MNKIELKFRVNNRDHSIIVDGNRRLLDVLREDLNLTGVKEGCGVGECGACTVILNGKAVNSCLILAGQVQGCEIITIEGLEGENGELYPEGTLRALRTLHPLQQAFIDAGAVQCGFCTPGIILSAFALLAENPNPGEDDIKEALSGNLCRCTGYKQIIEAVKLASKEQSD
jgi:carbon-monoxide dehydrogenase small subunit